MSVRQQKQANGRTIWLVDILFEHADGRAERIRKKSPVQTRRGAEEYERQLRGSLLGGTYGKEGAGEAAPTLDEFAERFLGNADTNNKPSTAYAKKKIVENHLGPFFGAMRLNEIGPEDVERFKEQQVAAGLSPKSINNQLGALRRLLELAREWGRIAVAPKVKELRLPPQSFEFLTFDEADRFLAAAAERWATALTVALKTGVRPGELRALQWPDVDLKAGKIVVRRTLWRKKEGTPKGGRSREIPLSPLALAALKKQQALTRLKSRYVFADSLGDPLTEHPLEGVVQATCRRAGIAKSAEFSWHELRHSFASHLVMRGVPLKTVQELMGHATIEMTMRYAHLSPDVKRDAVAALDVRPHGNGTATASEEEKKEPEISSL